MARILSLTKKCIAMRSLHGITETLCGMSAGSVVGSEEVAHYSTRTALVAREIPFEVCGLRRKRAISCVVRHFFGLRKNPGGGGVCPQLRMQPAIKLDPFGGYWSKRITLRPSGIAQ